MGCKNLCLSKICPKPSFFPRLKKVFVPADKKACQTKKDAMSWKEFLSFLLPEPAPKPPLIKCRKLQTQRRKCCGNPMNCNETCINVNCCPPPKEWYGQAEIFAVPSSLPPIPTYQHELPPCAPPSPSEPICVLALKGICPTPKKSLNMDDYAYKRAFSVIACDEVKELHTSFKLKNVCTPQLPGSDKNLRLSCGFFSEFKEVECPKLTTTSTSVHDMPPLICSSTQSRKKYIKKDINVEIKKGVCGRTTFLKPYKYGDTLPGDEHSRKFHTLSFNNKHYIHAQKKNIHSTSVKHDKENEGHKVDEAKMIDVGSSYQKHSYTQPAKSGVGLHYMLLQPLSGRIREGLMNPPEPYPTTDEYYNNLDSQDIDPELSKLAEETRKKMTFGVPSDRTEQKETVTTLAKQLSKMADEKMVKKIKEKGEERPLTPTKNPYHKSKLSLLHRKRNPTVATHATFMTEANLGVKYTKKKDNKHNPKKDQKNIICEGCLGIKAAEKEEKNPTPKSFLDCKVRPAGRCRGPQRKVYPDEGEPTNPYWKSKQRPYSLCNQQRPVIKKKERPYKMPCEDNNPKREFHSFTITAKPEVTNINKSAFHSSTSLNETETSCPTLYDIVKVKGLKKSCKQLQNHSNDWDSHTSDSYGERTYEEFDSVPDLSKYQPKDDETAIKKMSYPINIWENSDNKLKSSYNSWKNNDGNMNNLNMNRTENLNQNAAFKKRTPLMGITKEPINNAPSKYNVLFNPKSINKQMESDRNMISFINTVHNQETKHEKRTNNSKSKICDIKPENKELTKSKSKELPQCQITTQNMWGEPQFSSTSQNQTSMELIPQEIKSWDKQSTHHASSDNTVNDQTAHDIFRTKEEQNISKIQNENQSTYYTEKKSLITDSGDSDNISLISGSKS